MATKVVMAQLSPTMEEGKLIEWKVDEGDTVAQGDVVAEIETDKANMEVEAMGGGVLRKILVPAGETVPVGALIGIIAEPDEDIDDLVASAGGNGAGPAGGEPAEEGATAVADEDQKAEEEEAEEAEAPEAEEKEARKKAEDQKAEEEEAEEEPEEAAEAEEEPEEAPEAEARERSPAEEPAEEEAAAPRDAKEDGRVKASPVARRLAAENDLDLGTIEGSGPGGRIVKADVEAALEAPAAAPAEEAEEAEEEAPARAPAAAPAAEPRLESRVEEASQMRKAIARRLVQSIGPVPHFFLTTEIDMGRALELRAELNQRAGEGKIGVTDLLLKATAEAIVRHPDINASWEDGSVRYHGSVDLGIAVAVEEGLITPVLRDAGRKGLRAISEEARDLIERARARDLSPEEYQGATFSVSNLGMYDIDEFTAIINPPEGGILAIGRTAEKPIVVDGEVVVRKRMRVTMSCDHRVIDGASGAEFLATFKAMLENPLEMIL